MESIWAQTCEIKAREPLHGNAETEIAVIGAGMAGLLIAHMLQEAGFRTLVLEADRIAGGQTRNTTAKITSQHGLFYHKLIQTMGTSSARAYAAANEAAIAEFRRLIQERSIDCEFEELRAYLYGSDREALQAEAESASSLGLPATFVDAPSLPFPVSGVVCFDGQAQFHPLKFLKALSAELTIYEKTRVSHVEENRILTDRGIVTAEKILFACHYPFVNFPGMYFARMHQERSYVLALEHASNLEGMWIGADENSYSFRNAGRYLLLGGGGHRCGENSIGGRYEALRERAKAWFPGSREIAHWSAQDCVTVDDVPYIGRYADSRPNWYVATGFRKWGMTSSMVAALVLRDLLTGKSNPAAAVFAPERFDLKSIVGIVKEGAQAAKGMGRRLLKIPKTLAAELPAGHGGVVLFNGEKIGVYKDENGRLYPVDLTCPHLGCQLEWNPDEKSWDCPCHGSRFDRFGTLLSGPAQTDLSETVAQGQDESKP